MKLWRATGSVEVFIASEDEPDDRDIQDAIHEEVTEEGGFCIETCEASIVDEPDEIPVKWRDITPRGDNDDEATCTEIVIAYLEAEKAAALLRPMPNQKSLPIEP